MRAKKSGSSNLPSQRTFDRMMVSKILRRVTGVMSLVGTPLQLLKAWTRPRLDWVRFHDYGDWRGKVPNGA
jgi:hypothetical protein